MQKTLHHALGFNPDDLAFNQKGTLSSKQYRKLLRKTAWALCWIWLCFLFSCPFFLSLAGPELLWKIVVAGFGLLFIGMVVMGVLTRYLAIHRKQVRYLDGHAKKQVAVHYSQYGTSTETYYTVGRLRLPHTRRLRRVLVEGANYRVYFLSGTNIVLSIESLKNQTV